MNGSRILCVCGPSGCGKTTVGSAVAAAAGCAFLDADSFHPTSNVAKMAAGVPLTDDDRRPWLEALHAELRAWASRGESVVLACSALKAEYRTILACGAAAAVGGSPSSEPPLPIDFVLLIPPREALAARLAAREAAGGHFMPARLLDSQLEVLEAAEPSGWLLVIDDARGPEAAAAAVGAAWRARWSQAAPGRAAA